MDRSEQEQLIADKRIEKMKDPDSGRENAKSGIFITIAENKKASELMVDSEARTMTQILGSLGRQTERVQENPDARVIAEPEVSLDQINADLASLENSAVDENFSKVLISAEMKASDVRIWMKKFEEEIGSLDSEKESLASENILLSEKLAGEDRKNLLVKLFRKKERQAAAVQLEAISGRISQTDWEILSRKMRMDSVRPLMRMYTARQQGLILDAVDSLFQRVASGQKQFRERLAIPAVKQELNAELIAKKVLPELDKLQEEEKITKEEAEEYLGLLKIQLAEGNQSDWNDPVEKKEAIEERRKRVDELDRKSGYKLKGVGQSIGSEEFDAANNSYDKIFDLLLREEAKEEIEQLRDSLCISADSELQDKIVQNAKMAISPHLDWRKSKEAWGDGLGMDRLPSRYFKELDGLERWPIVKEFSKSTGLISEEIFAKVEKVIIQKLFDEQLFPGGRESYDGTDAANKMGRLGSPEALPLMLRQIEIFGTGHTTNAVVHNMEKILAESDPAELQRALRALPKKERDLLQTLADENSYMSRFGRGNSRYHICYLLQNGDSTLGREQLTKILDESGGFTESELQKFYFNTDDRPDALEPLLKERQEVERVIIESKLSGWTKSSDKLLAALVNPRNGDIVAFPKKIMQEGLGISDEKMLAVLENIFAAKTFKGSGFEREAFLDGLILLNSKKDGKSILETLLGAYRGAKNDPARIRRIFQLLSTLDSFGEFVFITPDQEVADQISQRIADLQTEYSQTKDKAEKKQIRNKLEALNVELQNLTGLKGVEDAMTQKVVEVACRRLELPQEYREKIGNNLDELMKGGALEIIPSLAGKYEGRREMEVRNLLRTITEHIVEGDFNSWRYSHEKSATQLAGLTEEQKEFWKTTLDPIKVDVELQEGERGRREDELKAAQEIIKNAKEHILDSKPDFDFSEERVQTLERMIGSLTDQIRSATSEEEKKRFIAEKRRLEMEMSLIRGILAVENTTPQSFTREKILDKARELRERIAEMDLPLAGLDIDQIGKIFTVGDIKSITAYESDDALTLLNVGVEPQETCQSWRNGGFNECLLAYVADSNKKVINIADGEGRIVARSVVKLTDQRDENDFDSKTQRKTLLVEKPYSLLPNAEVYRAFMRLLLTKAQGLGVSITFDNHFDDSILEIFKEEAGSFGYEAKGGNVDIFIPQSLNKYEYSDTLGGKVGVFDRYQSLEAVTFERVKI